MQYDALAEDTDFASLVDAQEEKVELIRDALEREYLMLHELKNAQQVASKVLSSKAQLKRMLAQAPIFGAESS